MRYVYVSELRIPIRLKVIEKKHDIDIEELEKLRSKAIEIVSKALEEAGVDFDGVTSMEIELVPDWLGGEVL